MRVGCMILDALHLEIGFDMTSVVREYCVQVSPHHLFFQAAKHLTGTVCMQVPLEFDFLREATNATAIRATLLQHQEHLPLLRKVCHH